MNDIVGTDTVSREEPKKRFRFGVLSRNTEELHLGAKRRTVQSNIGSSASDRAFVKHPKDWDWRFGRDARHFTRDVAIKNQIADHNYSRR